MEQSGNKNDEIAEALFAAPRGRRCFDNEKDCKLSCTRRLGKVHISSIMDSIIRELWRRMQHVSAERSNLRARSEKIDSHGRMR